MQQIFFLFLSSLFNIQEKIHFQCGLFGGWVVYHTVFHASLHVSLMYEGWRKTIRFHRNRMLMGQISMYDSFHGALSRCKYLLPTKQHRATPHLLPDVGNETKFFCPVMPPLLPLQSIQGIRCLMTSFHVVRGLPCFLWPWSGMDKEN